MTRANLDLLRASTTLLATFAALGCGGCDFDRGDRWDLRRPSSSKACQSGETRCTARLERCVDAGNGGSVWTIVDDCAARGQVCAPALMACAACYPNERSCLLDAAPQAPLLSEAGRVAHRPEAAGHAGCSIALSAPRALCVLSASVREAPADPKSSAGGAAAA